MLTPVLRLATPADKAKIEEIPFAQRMRYRTIYELLKSVAAERPSATALSFLASAQDDAQPITVSSRLLVENVTRAANLFTRQGAGRDSSVAILLPILPDTHYALWGAEAASIAMPMNVLLSVDHICDLVRAGNSRVLVAAGPSAAIDIWQKAEAVRSRIPDLKLLCVPLDGGLPPGASDFRALLGREPADALLSAPYATPETTIAYFHTGGTTGAPKLAKHSNANQLFSAWACVQMFDYQPGDRIMNGFPLFHVAGAIIFGLAAVGAGAEVMLPTPGGLRNKQVVQNHWKLVERFRPTIVCGAPTSLAATLNVPVGDADISSANIWGTGGALLPQDLADAFEAEVGLGIREIFGMTETAGVIAITPRHGTRRAGWIGFPLPYCELKVAKLEPNGTAGATLRAGQTGCVLFRGPNVFQGYLDPSRNKGVLLDDGWLMSGDIGRIDEQGYVCLTGRAKDVIIRGGHNIDPQMIEEAATQHPDVMICAAVGQPDCYAGEVPVLYVMAKPGVQIDVAQLMDFVTERVAERPARPRSIYVVPEIPTTEVGKIFKPALRLDATRRAVTEITQRCAGDSLEIAVAVHDDDKKGCLAAITVGACSAERFDEFARSLKTEARGLPVALEVMQASR